MTSPSLPLLTVYVCDCGATVLIRVHLDGARGDCACGRRYVVVLPARDEVPAGYPVAGEA